MKVVITGGPFSGKTSLVNRFHEERFQIVPEAAMTIIEQLIQTYGKEPFLAWKKNNLLAFQKIILDQQLTQEHQLNPRKLTILDRGTIDSIAYLRHANVPPTKSMLTDAAEKNYDLVILCETLKYFNPRKATGRTESCDESIKLHRSIENTYLEFGYKPVKLAANSLIERMIFIHQLINKKLNQNAS